jgi:hypothetical protein
MKRLLVSFSGGKTSAYMAICIKQNYADKYDEVITVFANTGQEKQETLDFVNKVDKAFDLNVVWLESNPNNDERKSSGFSIVSYETASIDGSPFQRVIQKYGIANKSYPHCTRELKINPIHNYARSIGWEAKTYDTAIGIRSDEMDRINPKYKEHGFIYPLVFNYPKTKQDIEQFWATQPFTLNIKEHEGNCTWCWKKSDRKLYRLAKESPSIFNFPMEMEKKYGNSENGKAVFFRNHRSTEDVLQDAMRYVDIDSLQMDMFEDLDVQADCRDSCEADDGDI